MDHIERIKKIINNHAFEIHESVQNQDWIYLFGRVDFITVLGDRVEMVGENDPRRKMGYPKTLGGWFVNGINYRIEL